MNRLVFLMSVATVAVVAALVGCAGERQGLVCDEMEYRLNTMTYSPDQRAYAEEELRVCREQEAEKRRRVRLRARASMIALPHRILQRKSPLLLAMLRSIQMGKLPKVRTARMALSLCPRRSRIPRAKRR